jgi:hypothetical protein
MFAENRPNLILSDGCALPTLAACPASVDESLEVRAPLTKVFATMFSLPVNPILPLHLLLGLALFRTVLNIYVVPRLARWTPAQFLTPILLLHALRELGLMFMFEGATLPGMPMPFAVPAALGDFVAAALAAFSLYQVRRQAASAKTWVWIFNIWGTLDLIAAVALAVIFKAAPHLGAAYWIPSFWVPMLLATHAVVFVYLRKHWATQP